MDIIDLIVGGIPYCISRSKLAAHPRTKLGAAINNPEAASVELDKHGAYTFPDRNGEAFEFIHHFYEHDGTFPDITLSVLQNKLKYTWEDVRSECQFFKIPFRRTTLWQGSYSTLYQIIDKFGYDIGLLIHRSIENCRDYASIKLANDGQVMMCWGDNKYSCEETREVDFAGNHQSNDGSVMAGTMQTRALYRFLAESRCKQIRSRIFESIPITVKSSPSFKLTIGEPIKGWPTPGASFLTIEITNILDFSVL